MEINSPNFSCVIMSLWVWACCPASPSNQQREMGTWRRSTISLRTGWPHFQTAKARCHETCWGCLPAVHAKESKVLGYTEGGVSNSPREEILVSKRSQKTLSRILGTITWVQPWSKMGAAQLQPYHMIWDVLHWRMLKQRGRRKRGWRSCRLPTSPPISMDQLIPFLSLFKDSYSQVEGNFAKVIRKLRRPSHRRRLKRCAVPGKMKGQNGVGGFPSVCQVRGVSKKPVLAQEQMGMKLYSLGPHGAREITTVGECQGSRAVVVWCMKRAEVV